MARDTKAAKPARKHHYTVLLQKRPHRPPTQASTSDVVAARQARARTKGGSGRRQFQ